MGKYNDFFSEMTKEQKQKLKEKFIREYKAAQKDTVSNMKQKDWLATQYKDNIKWMKLGIKPLDIYMAGPFSITGMMDFLGLDLDGYIDHTAVIKAMDNCVGVTRFELKQDEKGKYSVEYSKEAKADKDALDKKDVNYTLTRWDKFWKFFGIKTDHMRAVETNVASVKAYEKKQQELNNKVMDRQFKKECDNMLDKTQNARNHIKERINAAKEKKASWNNIFFDGKAPKDYSFSNGKKVSALSLCMAIMHQRGKFDLSVMDPKTLAQEMEKDINLKNDVKKLGSIIFKMAEERETAIKTANKFKYLNDMVFDVKDKTKGYDQMLLRELKPQKSREFRLSETTSYIMKGKEADNEKKEMFGNYCVVLKTMNDMAKIFGKNDEIYGNKNAIDKSVEEQIKDTITMMKLSNALEKGKYDIALETSRGGKADYKDLDEVITHCERRINGIEAEYNRDMKSTSMRAFMNKVSEEKQKQEVEIDDMFAL